MELDHAQLLEQRGAPGVLTACSPTSMNCSVSVLTGLSRCWGELRCVVGGWPLCQGQDERAAEFFQAGLEDCMRSHDKRVLYGFLGQAQLAANQGDYGQAFVRLRDAERLMQQRQIPDTVYRGALLQVSSHFWLQQGRPELAHEALTRVLRHYRGPHARQAPPATMELIPRIEYLLVLAEVHLQRALEPLTLLKQFSDRAEAGGAQGLEAELHLAIAEVAFVQGNFALAREALEQGLRLVRRCNLPLLLSQLCLRQPNLLAQLGMIACIAAQTDAMSDDNPLSVRETQVLTLIASGNSNQQIAEQLFISLHTVKTHIRRIHGKLGVERRTHAVAKARLLGLWK